MFLLSLSWFWSLILYNTQRTLISVLGIPLASLIYENNMYNFSPVAYKFNMMFIMRNVSQNCFDSETFVVKMKTCKKIFSPKVVKIENIKDWELKRCMAKQNRFWQNRKIFCWIMQYSANTSGFCKILYDSSKFCMIL